MKKYFFVVIVAVAGLLPASAQTGNASFDEFRRSINNDFQSFRKKVLDDYADFLDGIWKEYNAFKANERDSVPKPQEQPMFTESDLSNQEAPKQVLPTVKPKRQERPKQATPKLDAPSSGGGNQDAPKYDIPKLDFSDLGPKKQVPTQTSGKEAPKQEPQKTEAQKNEPIDRHKAEAQNEPKRLVERKKEPKAKPEKKKEPVGAPEQAPKKIETPPIANPQKEPVSEPVQEQYEPVFEKTEFMYHSVAFEVPKIQWECDALPAGATPKDFAKLWKKFSALKIENSILPQIIQKASECKLNDWLLCESIRCYADSEMAAMKPGQRMSLTHYLLTHAGFDVRIGLTSSNEPLLLIALKQEIYGRSFTTLNNTKYYLFFDNLVERDSKAPLQFFTCDIPTNVDCGKKLDLLILEEPNIPYQAHEYSFSFDGVHIKGEVNANLMPMLYRYPQMEMAYFAQSVVSERTQESIARQIATQLETLPERVAVDKLLKFVQSAFEYATDGEQHGFEKPYFFEEILYYPKCDCEDRSIFYSYLLKVVLGVENHLIGFPGHESVSVHLGTAISGHGYKYRDKNFYISDPTYIGASTGMCMPNYVNVTPEIDFER